MIRQLATRIVAAELHAHKGDEPAQCLSRVFRRLHDMVTPVVGDLGFAAVLKRAVWLSARSADAEGFPAETGLSEADLGALVEKAGATRTTRWVEEIVHEVLMLLNSFLGEKLTLRLVERAFPTSMKGGPAE